MLLTIRQLQVKYGDQTALQIDQPISFERGENRCDRFQRSGKDYACQGSFRIGGVSGKGYNTAEAGTDGSAYADELLYFHHAGEMRHGDDTEYKY